MQSAPLPANERERLARLRALEVLDTAPELELDALIRAATLVCGVPISLISLIDADRQWFKANIGLEGTAQTPRDVAFCAHAILGDTLMEVPDARADPRFADNPLVASAPDIRFYAGVPLTLSDGLSMGTLCVIDRVPRQLDDRQREILTSLGQAAAAALERSVRNKQLERAQRAMEQSHASEHRLAAIIEHSVDAIISKDMQSRVVTWNQSATRLFGYTAQEMIGQRVDRIFPVDRRDEDKPLIERLHRGELVGHFETLRLHRDGHPIAVSITLSPIFGVDHKVVGISKIVRDVSQRIAAEAALKASEQNYRNVVDALFEGVVLQKSDGTVVACNRSAEAMLGLTYAQMAERQGFDPGWPCIHEDMRPYPRKDWPFLRALSTGRDVHADVMGLFKPDGSMVWLEVNAKPIFDGTNPKPTSVVSSFIDITQRKLAQDAQRVSEQRWQSLNSFLPVGIFQADAKGFCTYTNPRWQEIYGLTPEESLGLGWRNALHPDDAQAVSDEWERTTSQGLEFAMAFRAKRRDGAVRYVKVRARPETNAQGEVLGFVGSIADVTDEHEAQSRIDNLTSRLTMATAAAGFGIWEFDFALGELIWDDRMYQMHWADRAAGLNLEQYWRTLVHPEDLRATEARLAAAGRGDAQFDAVFRLCGPQGQTRVVRAVAVREADARGNALRLVGLNWDITEQTQQQEALQAAKEAAEQANLSKSQFLANMSHEIRTPMNAVLGMSYLLGTTALNADQRRYVEMVRVSGQNLLGLLNDILDFSKIEAGRMELAPVDFAVDDVLSALASSMTVSAGEKPLELAIGVAPDVPHYVHGDAMRLQQILVNLTSNAIKFTAHGEVAVSVRVEDRQADGIGLRFEVRDTGIGLKDAQIGQIFMPFSQADASITRRFGGTGLGLSITRQLVEMMGGTIGVESHYGQGSCFWFTTRVQEASGPAGVAARPADRRRHALVVDDNATSRRFLGNTLRGWGWHCIEVESGAAALAACEAGQADGLAPDVVLVDWEMPGMDGLETARALRARYGKRLPVVVMVNTYARARLTHQQAGDPADGVLIKPFTASSVLSVLHEVLHAGTPAAQDMPDVPDVQSAGVSLAGRHLLLVDDNGMNQAVGRGILEHAGATVDVAENGEEALALLGPGGRRYDLVLMDIQMPVMDGLTATRKLRTELHLTLPVLAMTAGVLPAERARCVKAGMDDLIGKPLEVEAMLATIAHHCGMAHGRPVPQRSAELTVFDPEAMLAATGNSPTTRAVVVALAKDLVAQGMAPLQTVARHLQNAESTAAVRLLHSLRGSLGSVGAKAFAASALALEHAVQAGDAAQRERLMNRAEGELHRVLEAAGAWLATQESAPAPAASAQAIAPDDLLHFSQALAHQDMNALMDYTRLQPQLDALLDAPSVAALALAMSNLSFDEALQILNDQGVLSGV